MPIKMVVYDFDGVIIESGRAEKLWRWLAEKIKIKTPKILFFLQEIIEFITDKKLKPKKETKETIEIIKISNQKNRCLLGILTDRSLWSLAYSLKRISLNFNDFDFIQTRENILDWFTEPCFFSPSININKSAGTKPDKSIFENLKKFAEENKISAEDILIIEDSKQMIEFARAHNFYAINVADISCVRYYV
ncbi:MAG: hypothetical protein AAB564_00215 [Patescibacteria group bacterium]